MTNLDGIIEGRDELSRSIERLEELLEILENLERHPQQMIKDDVILYFGNLAKIIRLDLKMIDRILHSLSDLDKKTALNKKLVNLLLEAAPPEIQKRSKAIMKD
jgi:hypothetical protein